MKIGHTDNPVTETLRIFPNSYFISVCSSPEVLSKNGFNLIELHLQTFTEAEKEKELEQYVTKIRIYFDLVMHCPFIGLEGEKYKLLLPEKVSSNTMSEKADINKMKRVVELCSKLGIIFLTIHASSALKLLIESEFSDFKKTIMELNLLAKSKGVVLCVETGGLSEEQLADLIKNGLSITFDTSHFFLDMTQLGIGAEKANQKTLEFFKSNQIYIPVAHMSQPVDGKDAHASILDNGMINVHKTMLNMIKEKNLNTRVVFEFKPNPNLKVADYF
ncbi:MAG: sugar phosphate isomerase/epimerase [Actinomycetia bacterium]|nr:sugar phosphate isomerase/epimerase [Actinomycetes bacterium]